MFMGGSKQNTHEIVLALAQQGQQQKREGLEVQGVGLSNLNAIWFFLDDGSRLNEFDEVVNDATSLSIAIVFRLVTSNAAIEVR